MSRSLYDFDTIAAVATAPGYGGIGVIRLSGRDALSLTSRLLGVPFDPAPQRASLHSIPNPVTGALLDEAVITFFKAPNSFTGEDVVEISCHGSPVVLSEVLRSLLSFGARAAEPGEFSLRAFLNGRMDLAQAEAIRDLIDSRTAYQAQLAARQLRGELSQQLQPLKQRLIDLIVHFESAVEFVEDDLDPLDIARFTAELDDVCIQLSRLADSFRFGRIVRNGIRLAIVGRPNVGKSSLFNALLGRNRAIVSDIPGTTRDTISETLAVRGIPVELLDTAGIRSSDDRIEQLGVERTHSAATDADIVVAVLDASAESIRDDMAVVEEFPVDIFAVNKCDLDFRLSDQNLHVLESIALVVKVSALTGDGLQLLLDMLYERVAGSDAIHRTPGVDAIITSERHFAALNESLYALRQARSDLERGFTEEIALANLHAALKALGLITGETLIDDIIHRIFATFCIGK